VQDAAAAQLQENIQKLDEVFGTPRTSFRDRNTFVRFASLCPLLPDTTPKLKAVQNHSIRLFVRRPPLPLAPLFCDVLCRARLFRPH
jgi:hypothetical protein